MYLIAYCVVGVCIFFLSAFPQAEEDEEVREVHCTEDEYDDAEFGAEKFHESGGRADDGARLEGQGDVPEVDEVESHDEQFVDGVCEGIVAFEDIDEEDATVFEEDICDPDGEADADGEVDEVCDKFEVHVAVFFGLISLS